MSDLPTREELRKALAAASTAHHDYETNALQGKRDEQWSGWYAAYVLGRLGDFASATQLAAWLAAAPSDDDWVSSTAEYVLGRAGPEPAQGRGD